MTEFINLHSEGPESRSRRDQASSQNGAAKGTGEEKTQRPRRRREAAPEEQAEQTPMISLDLAIRLSASLDHPMRDTLRQFREELKNFTAEANRPSGPIGFTGGGPEPVSIAVIRACCRETAARLEDHVTFLGDGTPRALKMRLLAQAAQTEIQEFDIYLTQSNFRGGLVPEGELSGVLLAVNGLRGNLGQRLVEFDAINTALDG